LCKYSEETLKKKTLNYTDGVLVRSIFLKESFYNCITTATTENKFNGYDGILLDHVTMTGFQAVAQGNMAFVNLDEEDRKD